MFFAIYLCCLLSRFDRFTLLGQPSGAKHVSHCLCRLCSQALVAHAVCEPRKSLEMPD